MTIILRAATRGSPLALWQTNHIAQLLNKASTPHLGKASVTNPTPKQSHQLPHQTAVLKPAAVLKPVVITTTGDRRPTTPIHEMGGKGVFVKEVQNAVLDGRADIAVHSTKDLPSVSHSRFNVSGDS